LPALLAASGSEPVCGFELDTVDMTELARLVVAEQECCSLSRSC